MKRATRSPYARIYEVVARVPPGRVATYGQVASVAGIPGRARKVGNAMAALPEGSGVPWHRVVNASGRLSVPADDRPLPDIQRFLLEQEGVRFEKTGAISLEQFRWRPAERPRRTTRRVIGRESTS